MDQARHSAITPKAAAHVLWHYGHDGGRRPGPFVRNLLNAVMTADRANTALLARVYPGHVAAVELAEHHGDGIERLERIAATPAAPAVRGASS